MDAGASSSYPVLKTEVLQFLRDQSVDGRIQAMILDLVNQALRTKSVDLSNTQKQALVKEVLQDVLGEMLAR